MSEADRAVSAGAEVWQVAVGRGGRVWSVRATTVQAAICGFVVFLFVIANLPWHLDNYDQAKQAYIPYEILETGEWMLQSTPQGRAASKPPLMGWASALLRMVGLPWDISWRLPGFLCAVAMLWIVMAEGRRMLGVAGATLAAAAIGLNLLTPRLATLVRTDLMLAFFIFVVGWMIFRKVRDATPWTWRERGVVAVAMVAALFTKGPVIYAFLLPGMFAFAVFARPRGVRGLVWSGWVSWLIPLALFLAWSVYGILTDAAFFDDVVVREFLSRFQEGARSDERPQPWWFYFPHLLHKFAPWSIALILLPAFSRTVRTRMFSDPALLWLFVWAIGGLVVMTVIPAKRVDRIYPVIPPLVLLMVGWFAVVWAERRVRLWAAAAVAGAVAFAGGYFVGLVPLSWWERTPAVTEFAADVRAEMEKREGVPLRVLRVRDEGMLLYLDQLQFTDKREAFEEWADGGPVALVMSGRTARQFFEEVGPVDEVLNSGLLYRKNEKRYFLFVRE